MSKQDRQGVRTPTDIERKYDLGQIGAVRGLTQKQELVLNQMSQKVDQFIVSTNGKIEELENEIGEAGFSPNVTVEQIEGGHRVTITDAEGTESFDVMDGESGNAEVTEESITNALGFKPAPSGFGYGDVMTFLSVTDGTFETQIDEILSAMSSNTAKQLVIYDTQGLASNKFVATLWKYTPNYATLEAVTYHGNNAIKCKASGEWKPWEWINPPMTDGTEYRTTKRLAGKPVYVQCGSIGALPSTSTTTFSVSTSGSTLDRILILSVEAYNTSNRKYMLPFINTSGEIRAIVYATGARTFTIKTFSDLSDYSARYYIEYTKA